MVKTYIINFEGKQIKLWQNDDASWGADGGLDPSGFTYDPAMSEENRFYELDYLVGHGETPEAQANDLARQYAYLKSMTDSEQLAATINQKVKDGTLKPEQVKLKALAEIYQNIQATNRPPQKLIEQNILDILGLDNLPTLEKKELIELFSQTIFQAVILRIAARIPKEKRDNLLVLLDQKNEEAVGKFLKENCSNLDEVTLEESLKFKQVLISKNQEVGNKLQMAKIQAATATATV